MEIYLARNKGKLPMEFDLSYPKGASSDILVQGKYKEMMDAYTVMLTYIKSAATRNYSEKCIYNIMDFVSGSASQNFDLLQEFYQTTLKTLEEAKNERLWFKTNLKLCKIWFDMGEYGRMNKILKEIHKSCRREDGSDDQKKGTQLLEVYAIEIQMYTETKNNKKPKVRLQCFLITSKLDSLFPPNISQ